MPAHALMPARRQRATRTIAARLCSAANVLATMGSLVTLTALLVLAGAVGGLVDGVPTGPATVTVTFDSAGH